MSEDAAGVEPRTCAVAPSALAWADHSLSNRAMRKKHGELLRTTKKLEWLKVRQLYQSAGSEFIVLLLTLTPVRGLMNSDPFVLLSKVLEGTVEVKMLLFYIFKKNLA